MAPPSGHDVNRKIAPADEESAPVRLPSETVPTFSRAGWLAEILRGRILNGFYAPGERIRETSLRNEFGFSNGPTREALQLVVASGLAERAPWQGVRVISLTEREIVEIFQLRVALMEYAAELAARFGPDEVLAQAPEIRRKLAEAFAQRRQRDGNTNFTGLLTGWILDAAGNTAIRDAWERGVVKARIYVNASIRRAAHPDHELAREVFVNDLIDSIATRDPVRARKAARDVTLQTLKDLGIDGRI
jgi:DNA-binding GntR family transcriptional regulator